MPKFDFNGKEYNNAAELAIDVIGGKYKMPILWRLKDKVWRYSELKKDLGKITHKMLSEQLHDLEAMGLIHREVYAVIPPKVEYSITEKGKTVIPIIVMLREWGLALKEGRLE
jgi:DNA-binding HxlR family transcriptional regulator